MPSWVFLRGDPLWAARFASITSLYCSPGVYYLAYSLTSDLCERDFVPLKHLWIMSVYVSIYGLNSAVISRTCSRLEASCIRHGMIGSILFL
jgi:hypothetical protein